MRRLGGTPRSTSTLSLAGNTAMIGNCSVTFAPCGPNNRRYLQALESVEDVAADAIMDGLPWDWTSYGQYLDSVQALSTAQYRRAGGSLYRTLRGHGGPFHG